MTGRNVFETLMGAVVLAVALFFVAIAYKSGHVSSPGGYSLNAKFDRVDGLATGSDVRIGGVKVGSVVSQDIDPETFQAIVEISIDDKYKLPKDSNAKIVSDGLLGGKYMMIEAGADDKFLEDNGEIKFTQSAISLEEALIRMVAGSVSDDEENSASASSDDSEDDIF